MSVWDALLGQPAAVQYLRAALARNRAAHGFLFEGPTGVGKRTGAMLLAQTMLCHEPKSPDEACGACRSCRWFAHGTGLSCEHPDVLVPQKLDTNGRPTGKLIGDQEPNIPIDSILIIAEQLHRSPANGPRRIAIIPEAHRLCGGQAEAANAFLKTLEEPPPSSTVIMTTSRPEALLETIISRLQPVRFRRLALEDVKRGLKKAGHADGTDVDLAAALCDGSLGQALALVQGDLKRWREALLKLLGQFTPKSGPVFGLSLWALAEGEGERLFEAAEEKEDDAAAEEEEEALSDREQEASAKTEAGWKRFVFRRLLELTEAAFRDALVAASGGDASLLLQGHDAAGRTLAQKLAERFGAEGCERILGSLREALLANRLYIRGDLIARFLSGRMAAASR